MRLLKQLYIQVLIGLAAAIVLGLAAPALAVKMKPFGDGFIALLRMLLGPIIFCTVVHGLAQIRDMRKLGRLATKSLIYFEVVSTLGIVIGAVAANIFHPGAGLHAKFDTNSISNLAGVPGTARQAHRRQFPAQHHSAHARRCICQRGNSPGPIDFAFGWRGPESYAEAELCDCGRGGRTSDDPVQDSQLHHVPGSSGRIRGDGGGRRKFRRRRPRLSRESLSCSITHAAFSSCLLSSASSPTWRGFHCSMC